MDAVRLLDALPLFGLYAIRVGALFAAMPFFGTRFAPLRTRVVLGLLLAVILFWAREGPSPRPLAPGPELALLGMREAALGALGGLLFQLTFAAARTAGTLIGQEMGLGIAAQVDPVTGEGSTLPAQLLEVLAALLFFALDGHHAVIRVLDAGLAAHPPGVWGFPRGLGALLLALPSQALESGFRVAGPVLVPLFLVTLTVALLSRAVPQLNVLDLGFPLRIGAALVLLPLSIPYLAPALRRLLALAQDAILTAVTRS